MVSAAVCWHVTHTHTPAPAPAPAPATFHHTKEQHTPGCSPQPTRTHHGAWGVLLWENIWQLIIAVFERDVWPNVVAKLVIEILIHVLLICWLASFAAAFTRLCYRPFAHSWPLFFFSSPALRLVSQRWPATHLADVFVVCVCVCV